MNIEKKKDPSRLSWYAKGYFNYPFVTVEVDPFDSTNWSFVWNQILTFPLRGFTPDNNETSLLPLCPVTWAHCRCYRTLFLPFLGEIALFSCLVCNSVKFTSTMGHSPTINVNRVTARITVTLDLFFRCPICPYHYYLLLLYYLTGPLDPVPVSVTVPDRWRTCCI